MAAPVMPQLMARHTNHFRQNHWLPIVIVSAQTRVEDDTAGGCRTEICEL